MSKPRQLTNWHHQNEMMATQWGNLSYLRWLRREAQRFTESGRKVEVITDGPLAALFQAKAP